MIAFSEQQKKALGDARQLENLSTQSFRRQGCIWMYAACNIFSLKFNNIRGICIRNERQFMQKVQNKSKFSFDKNISHFILSF